jgi:type II restriction/modification system DNA methylase subunit YeeA
VNGYINFKNYQFPIPTQQSSPLSISMSPLLSNIYKEQRNRWRAMTLEMQQLEEENNRIFIDAYGLQDELTPEVPLKEITLTCNPYYRYGGNRNEAELEKILLTDTIKELLSYSVGCMMGRYSLDESGLIYANANNKNFDHSRYKKFPADNDGIIPIFNRDWYVNEDIVERFREFVKVAFGENHLTENIQFVEYILDKDIRDFFVKDFFADHLKRYKKRPIYWLFSSGRNKAFQCLVYLHRYNAATLPRMRTEYVIPFLGRIRKRINEIDKSMENIETTNQNNKRQLEREYEQLNRQLEELKIFDDKLRHKTDKKIEIDLDDGVKVNYAKFGDLLSDARTVTGGTTED